MMTIPGHDTPAKSDRTSRMRVALRNCRFFAYHGVAAQERSAGNEFEVSLEVAYTPGDTLSDSIDATVSYADLYDLVKSEMEISSDLLETVAARIAESATRIWPQISEVKVTIVKITPPIPGFTGTAEVTFELNR